MLKFYYEFNSAGLTVEGDKGEEGKFKFEFGFCKFVEFCRFIGGIYKNLVKF